MHLVHMAPVSWWAAVNKKDFMNIKEWIQAKGREEIADIAKHGCRGGVSGVIYYSETSKFYDDHVIEIWGMLEDAADQEGQTLAEKVYSLTKDEESYRTFKNQLVWWAVEVRAQELQLEDAVSVGIALKAEKEDTQTGSGPGSEPAVKIP